MTLIKRNNNLLSLVKNNSARFHKICSIDKLEKDILPISKWPMSWKKIYYKEYPRFQRKLLQINKKIIKGSLISNLSSRLSQRNFTETRLTYEELSTLLHFASGINSKHKTKMVTTRFYPSAGQRYPLEIYLVVNSSYITELNSSSYHYNVKRNYLEEMFTIPNFEVFTSELTVHDWMPNAACLICISAVFNRGKVKYKDRAYRYCLFEAGHLAQNIYLLSESLGIKCCAIGGFSDTTINTHLELDPEEEAVVYILAIGK